MNLIQKKALVKYVCSEMFNINEIENVEITSILSNWTLIDKIITDDYTIRIYTNKHSTKFVELITKDITFWKIT